MAIPIEGFSVVVQRDRIQPLLEGQEFAIPNSTAINDEHLWKCSFMAHVDARKFLQTLENVGLNVSQGPDSDAVLVSEFDRAIEPYCEWLTTAAWEKAVIAWRTGTHPESVVARAGWDPRVGSGMEFHNASIMKHLQFLRLDNNVEVFLDQRTGLELYVGRTSTPLDALFMKATAVVREHFVTIGEPTLTGNAAAEVSRATEMLHNVVSEAPDWWNAQWFYGKGLIALGHHELAYQAFRRAYEREKNVETIPRELAGVCLELRRFDEAVTVAEQAVVLDPDNAELIGNLSLAYFMARRYEEARRSIDTAIRLSPGDSINRTVSRILSDIVEGKRAAPESLKDLSKPAKAEKMVMDDKPWWKLWG